MKSKSLWGYLHVYLLLAGVLFCCSPVYSQDFATNCSGCHLSAPGLTGGARVNAADAPAVITQANSKHSMAADSANFTAIAAEIGRAILTPARTATKAVNYGSSVSIGAADVPNVVLNDPLDPANAVITGYSYRSATTSFGTLSGSGTTSLTYQHTAANCSTDALTVFGTGFADTSDRFINVTVNAPTLTTPTNVPFTIAYSTSATTLSPLGTVNISAITSTGMPANGAAGLVSANALSYTSDAAIYNPQVTFSYLGQGPGYGTAGACGNSRSGSVVVNVNPPPAPTVQDIGTAGSPSYVPTSGSTTFDVTSRISGVIQSNPSGTYVVSISQQPSNSGGTASVSGKVITFTPAGGFSGATTIQYTMSGPGGTSAPGTIYINVTSAPTTTATTATTNYNTAANVALAGFINTSGAPITAVTVSNAVNGIVTLPGGSTSTTPRFTPNNNFFGTGSFQYSVTSAAGTSTPLATVTVTVNPPAPTASALSTTVAYNTPTTIDLLSSITPGATVTSVTPSGATGGSVSANGATTVLFTPTAGALGAASFNYTATNAGGISGSATVSINIPTPSAPVAVAQTATVVSSGASTITLAPTGVYTSVALGTLPTHGSASLSGSTVTYTPQTGYLGNDSFTYTATGPGGTSAAATVSITVLAVPTAPAVTRSTPVNTALVLDTTTVATGSFTSVTTSAPGHGAVAVNAKVITYTPTANYFGPDTFTYTVVGGAAGNATGTVTVNVTPANVTAAAATLTVALNSSATLDLTPFISGTAVTGVRIANAPAHGTVTVSGKTVTYAPARDYFGTDTFNYAAFGASGVSAPAAVTVTVTGRPDPTQNAAVTGMVANQTQTALRFSQAQVSNFGRHMEGLRRAGGMGLRSNGLVAGGTPYPGANATSAGYGNAAASSTTQGAMPGGVPGVGASGFGSSALSSAFSSDMGSIPTLPGQPNATRLPTGTSATASLPVESGVTMALNQLGMPQASLVGVLYNLDQNRKLDLGALQAAFNNDGQAGNSAPGNTLWVEGVVSFGSRDATGNTDAAQYNSSGVSIGMDIPVNDNFTWGIGLGLARDTADIGTDGTHTQAQGYSLAAYGSYRVGKNGFVEGMLGMGTIDYDMRRWVDPMADFALSTRKGTQIFGSLGGGLEYRTNGRMVSPYARLDFSQDKLAEVSETGAGNYALHYFEQTNNAQQAVLGLRGESTHSTSFGWAVPRARVEWRQDLLEGSDAVISYADQIGGTRYSIAPTDSRRSALVLGLGSEFLFRDGWSLGLDYQLSRISSVESSYALRVRLSKELGAKGPRKMLNLTEDFEDESSEITVDSSVTWDDNITRAKLGRDIRSDTIYTVNVNRTFEHEVGDNSRLLITGFGTGERFQSFNGLSHGGLGLDAALQYRANGAFSTPTWSLTGKALVEGYQSSLRDGVRYSLGGSVLQPLTNRINLFSALSYNIRNANNSVFSTQDTAVRVNVDYALINHSNLYFSGEFRDGDIISTGRRSLENITIARAATPDDAYPDGSMFSYRFQGTTFITTLGYNIGLGARDSVDLSWRTVQSTPSQRPFWVTSPASYITNQISASYLMRF